MPTFLIRHTTSYSYRNPVAFGEHRMLLRPRDGLDQRVTAFDLAIGPEPQSVAWSEDAAGNPVGLARFGRRARELSFAATARVEQRTSGDLETALSDHARTAPFTYGAEDMPDLARFIERRHLDPDHAVDGWARSLLAADPARSTWGFLGRLNAAIRRDFAYLRREEAGIQAPAFTLRTRSGTCRDFALLMIEAARALGLAARFVSGYLYVHGGPDARQAGGSTHAWLQVYLPGAGWADFDPTSGAVGNRDLVRVAAVRDPTQAAPLSGSFMGFPSDAIGMSVEVRVERDDPGAGGFATER